MAVDASSVSVTLGVGGAGGSALVTDAGVQFTTAANPSGTIPFWNYDGSNLNGNVPTGKGFAFLVNGVVQGSLNSIGTSTANNFQTIAGGAGDFQSNTSAFGHGFIWSQSPFHKITQTSSNGLYIQADATQAAHALVTIGTTTAQHIVASGVGLNFKSLSGQAMMAHMAGGSAAFIPGNPTNAGNVTIGLGAGTTSSGTAVTASGHDLAARVGVTLNSTGTVSQPILLGSWAANYNQPPFIVAHPANAATAAIAVAQAPFLQTTVSGWSLIANTTGLAAGTYVWYLSGIVQ